MKTRPKPKGKKKPVSPAVRRSIAAGRQRRMTANAARENSWLRDGDSPKTQLAWGRLKVAFELLPDNIDRAKFVDLAGELYDAIQDQYR